MATKSDIQHALNIAEANRDLCDQTKAELLHTLARDPNDIVIQSQLDALDAERANHAKQAQRLKDALEKHVEQISAEAIANQRQQMVATAEALKERFALLSGHVRAVFTALSAADGTAAETSALHAEIESLINRLASGAAQHMRYRLIRQDEMRQWIRSHALLTAVPLPKLDAPTDIEAVLTDAAKRVDNWCTRMLTEYDKDMTAKVEEPVKQARA